MNRRILILAVFAFAVIVLTGAALAWSSAHNRSNQRTSGAVTPQEARAGEPDTRRDVLIAANRAPQAAAFSEGTWINSQPMTLESLRGRVVLVDFWTFGCYNCRNTLPTLRRLDARYRERGLTIVGVHTPESGYERTLENVRARVRELNIRYPVVTDEEGDTWRAYNIQAWPTVVILDKQGRIRYTHIGEGDYEQQERIIQQLLAEQAPANTASASGATNDSGNNEGGAALEAHAGSNEGRGSAMTDRVTKTDEEWQRELTPEQYRVLREEGTERPFAGAYHDNHEEGMYVCAGCGNRLFSSDTKFDSGTGWPSFYAPAAQENVREERDTSLGMTRPLASRAKTFSPRHIPRRKNDLA